MTAPKSEFEALVESVGTLCVTYIGAENIQALSVEMNPRTLEGVVTVALTTWDDATARAAYAKFSEVEDTFFDEAVLSIRFVESRAEVAREANAPGLRVFAAA